MQDAQMQAAHSCTGLVEATRRLACYDAAFGRTVAKPAAQFGDKGQLPLERRQRAVVPKRLDARIRDVAPLAQGMVRLTLDNGQIWDTRESDWALDFQKGAWVTISRMVLDNYQVSLRGQGRSVGATRIQ